MNECGNCNWVGQWKTYEDAGYDGYLCDVCAWTNITPNRHRWYSQGEVDMAKAFALVANVICEKLQINFDLVVKANQLLLESDN